MHFMSPADRFSIITFSHVASVMFHLRRGTAAQKIKMNLAIDALEATRYTDIDAGVGSGATMSVYAEIRA